MESSCVEKRKGTGLELTGLLHMPPHEIHLLLCSSVLPSEHEAASHLLVREQKVLGKKGAESVGRLIDTLKGT